MARPAKVRSHFLSSRVTVVAAVVAVIGSYGVVGSIAPAYAASVTGSSFEIDTDANLVIDPAGLDWLSGGSGSGLRTGVVVKDDLPTGGGDDSFTSGTKNDSVTPTVDTGSVPNNKSDLTHFGTYVEKAAAATYVNVFWTRVQDPNGTTAIDFEFNQSATNNNKWGPQPPLLFPDGSTYYPNEVIPTRTDGDLLLTYELGSGGTNPTLSRRTWSAGAWGAATVFDPTQALGSINTSPIVANDAGTLGALGARTFGEASINLAALVPNQSTCTTFGSVYVKSRASDVLDEELKDFIAPEHVTISNCGSVSIHKTDDNGALAGAEFTLYKNLPPTLGPRGDAVADPITSPVLKCTTNASGDCTIKNVPKGDFWAVETLTPLLHETAPDQAVSITAGDQDAPLTFNDPLQKGTVIIKKAASPSDGTRFGFTFDGNSFDLADGGSKSFTVPVGSYTAVEGAEPPGWSLTGLICDDPTSDSTPTTSTKTTTASIKVANKETVTCTYTNAYTAQPPGLSTIASATAGGASGTDVATLTGDGTHDVTGSVSFYACGPTPAAADCTAAVGAGATLVQASVPVQSAGGTYSAGPSTALTPTVPGWYCFRAAFTSGGNPYYADQTQTDKTNECFLKSGQDLTVSKTATAAFGRHYSWTIDKTVD
ncbi:MAG: hypothetical protein JWO12_1789, partial [Frankiales bacterium]|nr:hypothetical protein [Frankiales bacterium]